MTPVPPQNTRPATIEIRPARDTDAKAVVDLLSAEHHLEVAFDPAEFTVGVLDGRVVACARMKPLENGGCEIASVTVAHEHRRHGFAARVVQAALAPARGPVYALALARPFFEAQGFHPLDEVPAPLVGKATSVCASSDFVPMVLRRD